MKSTRCFIALLCTLLLSPAYPQDNTAPLSQTPSHGVLGKITAPYRPRAVPAINQANSGRLESLLRGGNLYLSMQDTIALALENNLDIAIQRYGPQIADAAVLQAQA